MSNSLMPTMGSRNRWLLAAFVLGILAVLRIGGAIEGAGRYQLASSPNDKIVWRIDSVTGLVSMCQLVVDYRTGPACTPWASKPMP